MLPIDSGSRRLAGRCRRAGWVPVVLSVMAACGEAEEQDPLPDPTEIELLTRTLTPPDDVQPGIAAVNGRGAPRTHVYLQFYEVPDFAVRERLRGIGIRPLQPITAYTFFASVPAGLTGQEPELAAVRWIGTIDPADKIDPRVAARGVGDWAVNPDGSVRLDVTFFGDTPDARAVAIVAAHGGTVGRDARPLSYLLEVSVAPSEITALAVEDEVKWITDVAPPPVETNDGSRAWTNTDAVHALGVRGEGVRIGMWDGGRVATQHDDVGGRLGRNRGECPPGTPPAEQFSNHATHVAGTLYGTGALSDQPNAAGQPNRGTANQWMGHAPAAPQLFVDDFANGDVPTEMRRAFNNDRIKVANNSWIRAIGWARDTRRGCPDPQDNGARFMDNQSAFGSYTAQVSDLDAVVRLGLTVVFGSGNDRNDTVALAAPNLPTPVPPADFAKAGVPRDVARARVPDGYYTLAIPATAKNIITVGAIIDGHAGQADGDTQTEFSGWGPTDDGRIKPDLVAPGFRIMSSLVVPQKGYGIKSGTSMSAPAVSGIATLVFQELSRTLGRDPRPSSVKAALICTAADLGNAGPDFQNGWGKVDAKGAIDLVRDRKIQEDAVDNGDTDRWHFKVEAGLAKLKVGIVWDDPEAALAARRTLQNDLDLVLIDPAGRRYRPWLLDRTRPDRAAGRGPDSRNNVELVEVDSPPPGNWRADVSGTRVPDAPQHYSICTRGPRDLGDAPDRGVPRDYPTYLVNNGARHENYMYEWLGTSRGEEPSVSFEVDAEDPDDEDGRNNLVNQDSLDDGVDLPDVIVPGVPFEIQVRVASTVAESGFGPMGRYDQGDPLKRLYLNAWADWGNDGFWTGDKVIGTGTPTDRVAVDPENFGPNGRYTLGESFDDVGVDEVPGTGDRGEGNGVYDEGEPFVDQAGQPAITLRFRITPPSDVGREVWFRFRLDYGEDVGNVSNPNTESSLSQEMGAAQFGEVEDYVRKTVELDHFELSGARMQIEAAGRAETVLLGGPATVQVDIGSGGEAEDSDGDGLDDVVTEMVALEASGFSTLGALTVRVRDPGAHPNASSLGAIEELRNVRPGRLDLAPFCDEAAEPDCAGTTASSFFDIFFEIDTPMGLLHSHDPKHLEAVIRYKPPEEGYESLERIPLFDEQENAAGVAVTSVLHVPRQDEPFRELYLSIEGLVAGDAPTRIEMATRLGEMGATARDALLLLRQAAEDENPEVARSAAEAVERIEAALEREPPGGS